MARIYLNDEKVDRPNQHARSEHKPKEKETAAAIARKAADDWLKKATEENKEWNRQRIERERREAEAMWSDRGMMWVKKIEGYIAKASRDGKHGTWEPTSCNPHGDEILYIGKGDQPIYEKLMQYFRDEGFTVEEYQYMGMKITW